MTLAPSGAGGDKPIAMASAPDPTDAPTSATTLARHQSGAGEATIFATATGPGGAIAVMRVSGAATAALVATLAGRLPAPRVATLRKLRAADGTLLDRGLVLFNPAPRSYTGEDYAELHVHGGRAVRAALAEALLALGARPAEPGEFSRRAFGNGRLGLLEAEAVADLIAAETEAQRRLALAGAEGAAAAAIAGWRDALIGLMARQAALIDFADEDLPDETDAALTRDIAALAGTLRRAAGAAEGASRLREGLDIVVLGAPNAGKSTLVNAIAGEEVAIVSEIPGTTRDAVGTRVAIAGVPVRLTDTAGLRASDDAIEAEGVRRARARGAAADLVLALAAPPDFAFPEAAEGVAVLRVATKRDLTDRDARGADPWAGGPPACVLAVSAATGQGMGALLARIEAEVERLTARSDAASLARPRQIACLREMIAALDAARAETTPELRAEELQAAANALARLTGAIGVEDVLDRVFASFCIGK